MSFITPPIGSTPATVADRFAFLAQAGEALASSLDYEETLQQVARLAVPALGDLCIVDVVEDDGVRRVGLQHVLPEKRVLLEALAREYPPMVGSPAPAGRVLASGVTELLAHVDRDTVRAHTVETRHAEIIGKIGIRSHIAAPMIVRGRTLGVVSVGITESDRQYTQDDVLVVEEVTRRAAMAVENARLYRAAQREIEHRRRVEEQLRLSEARYRGILEQSPMSTQIMSPDGRTVAVNQAWEQLWGLSLADLADYSVLADPQLEEAGIAPLLRRVASGESAQLPTIPYQLDQTLPGRSRHGAATRWVSALAYPVRDGDGAVCEMVLIHTDVTDSREAHDRLRESDERLHRALAGAQMVVWDWDLVRGGIECSQNAVEFFGRHVGDAEAFLAAIHPDDLPGVRTASQEAIARGRPLLIEYRLRAPDGQERWVQSRGEVERNAEGAALRFLGVTLDITERKQAEEVMRLLADAGQTMGASLDYTTTLQSLSRLVVPRLADWYAVDLVAEDGSLQRVSVHHPDPERVELAERLFKRYPPQRGDPHGAWHVIDAGHPEWMEAIDDALLERSAQDAEHLQILRGLRLRSYICVPLVSRDTVIGAITLVFAESGRRYRAEDVEIAMDLARRAAVAVDNARLFRQLQDEHRRKDEFLATLAHELRNPLAPIRNGLAVLGSTPDEATAARMRAIMDRQLGQMVRLIDDLLDLSRVTRGAIDLHRQRIGIDTVVAAAVETSRPLLEAAGVSFATHLDARPAWLDADPTRLAQVLTNLLNNAAKFTPRGGRIDIHARAEGGDCLVEVVDTGIGISPARLEQVFEMFARGPDSADQGGLGIGLTLARQLIQLHGGSLRAESAGPGTGSRFIIRLPMSPPEESTPEASSPPDATRPRRHRVLVVDDNLDAAETLATLLRLDGHDVHTAGTAAEALAVAAANPPELAFLDIGLPDVSGHVLAVRLRALPGSATTRLVALTGWGRDEDRARAREAGFDDHLTKPVEAAAVLAQLAQLDAD